MITLFQMDIYDAAERYIQEKTPVIILAGKDYGSGSSRDWAAKGPFLQVKIVIFKNSPSHIITSERVDLPPIMMPSSDIECHCTKYEPSFIMTNCCEFFNHIHGTVSNCRGN